ncbi:COX15/CtaA family protein [Salana multivorans]|uniref:COX15/CtaA family protein n=1 Tax=Salana multivorans TaxID=120377 RepID=UPI0024907ABE|nr:COX15/CtaA family protein [Salana multivorans]
MSALPPHPVPAPSGSADATDAGGSPFGYETPRPARPTRLVVSLAWGNLALQLLIILTGGLVRLTGSGLGCSTWPQCEPGQFSPVLHEAASYHPFVEFGNRAVSVIVCLVAVGLLVAVWTSPGTRERRPVRLLAIAPLAGVLAQAVIGGITVLVELPPAVVGFHFLISAVLVWVSTLLLVRLREGDAPPRQTFAAAGWSGAWLRWAPATFAVLTALVVVLGILTTGAGPHSGDEEVGYRFALDPAHLAKSHAMAVWAFVAAVLLTLWLIARAVPGGTSLAPVRHARRAWGVLVVVTLAQGLIGYAQYFSGLPVPLVALHLVGSGLLVAAVTAAVLSLRVR